jgi:hypothetical protein
VESVHSREDAIDVQHRPSVGRSVGRHGPQVPTKLPDLFWSSRLSTVNRIVREKAGSAYGAIVIVNVRDVKVRLPVSQPFMKNTRPVNFVCPAAAPGDINDG